MSLPAEESPRPDSSRFLPFPQTWNETLPEGRISEVFGLAPLLFGLGFIGFGATLVHLQSYRSLAKMQDLPLIGGVLLVGVACLAYEIYRRVRSTRLLVQGERIAIYRGGLFSEEIRRPQVIHYQLNHENTFKMVAGPVVIGGTLLYLTLKPGDDALRPTLAMLGGVLWGLAASTLVTRLALRTYFIPRGNKREEIMLTRRGVSRLQG
jgi:hypothetical protein